MVAACIPEAAAFLFASKQRKGDFFNMKNAKKLLAVLLAAMMCIALAACQPADNGNMTPPVDTTAPETTAPVADTAAPEQSADP